jgi:hypothetical protein
MHSDPPSERSSHQPSSRLKAPFAQQGASKDGSSALRAMGSSSPATE